MTLAELIRRVRVAADDLRQPFLWADADIADRLNDAETEAAIRKRLLHEATDPEMCQIVVSAGIATYRLHAAMYELTYQAFRTNGETLRQPLALVSKEWLDGYMPDWRERTGTPEFVMQDGQSLRLAPMPDVPGHVLLEGYRVPLSPMRVDHAGEDAPEIPSPHHLHLIPWALYRGYSVPDTETFDPRRAQFAEDEFTRYFGPRPDADLRRETREDIPHRVEAFWA